MVSGCCGCWLWLNGLILCYWFVGCGFALVFDVGWFMLLQVLICVGCVVLVICVVVFCIGSLDCFVWLWFALVECCVVWFNSVDLFVLLIMII